MTGQQQGILAIWNDCRPGREAEFEAWFQGEHLLERLAVPGFLYGRRHAAISGSAGFFNYYLTQSPDVLKSKPYLERLDNPTPMTKRVMSEIFINMNRTVCHRTLRRGSFRGAYSVTARFNDTPDIGALTSLVETLVQDPAVAACEFWTAVDPAGQPVSMEEKLRGGDKKIKACLMVDTLRQGDAEKIGERLSKEFVNADVGVFRVLCQGGRGDI
jgi:hypothetical protein